MKKKFGKYYVTIGLEIHVALNTQQKLFSSTPNKFLSDGFALFDAGIPGVMPVLSKEPVFMAIALGLATKSKIQEVSLFDRKHYFYPDLPIGFQVTQQYQPILIGGEVDILDENGDSKKIIIEHSHLECDAAKSLHDIYADYTAIDLSRCASPLIEIVSTPCMSSPYEAKEYAKSVFELTTFLGICDGKIEEGSFRVDASISLNTDPNKLGTRVEIKNISSFNFLEEALKYEIARQAELINEGGSVVMETRLFNEKTMETKSMRKKETVDEYRYMRCPDISPLIISEEMVNEVKEVFDVKYFEIKAKQKQLFENFNIPYDASTFSTTWKRTTHSVWRHILSNANIQTERAIRMISFWIIDGLNDKEITYNDFVVLYESKLQAKEVKETIAKWVASSTLSIKECMPELVDDSVIELMVSEILSGYKEQIDKYKAGDEKIANFLVGKVMSQAKGKAPAGTIKEIVLRELAK